MALHETLVNALAHDVVFVNLRDLVDKCPILSWGEGPKMYETFVGRHRFKLPKNRAQTAAERTNMFRQIVETVTILEGTKTTFELYKLGGSEDIVEEQRKIMSKEVRQADHQRMDMSVYTRFGPALATFLHMPIVRMAVFEVVPCSVKEHMVSAWHVAFNRSHLNMLLHDRNWSGEGAVDHFMQAPESKDLWYDAILVMAEEWILPNTKHRPRASLD